MLQYQNMPQMKIRRKIVRQFTLENLKFALNVPQNAYEGRFNNFKKFVLDSPIEEINSKTIYQMNYTVQRSGHTPKSVEFTMDLSAVPVEEVFPRYDTEAINKLLSLKFSKKAAQEILSKCNGAEDCLRRIANAEKILKRQKRRNTTPVENDIGFLRKAILENWEPSSIQAAPLQIKPKVPATKEIFKNNRNKKSAVSPRQTETSKTPITLQQAQMLQDYLAGGSEGKKAVKEMLKSVGWTLDEFLKSDIYEKAASPQKESPARDLTPEQVEFLYVCLDEGAEGELTADKLLKEAGLTLEEFLEKYPL